MTPYTAKDVSAKTYNKPAFILAKTFVSSKGITAHAAKAGASESIGAIINSERFAFNGIMGAVNLLIENGYTIDHVYYNGNSESVNYIMKKID